MKQVKIYIMTSLKGPYIKDGQYAAVVEYVTKSGPVTREISGTEENTTYYRSVLLAIVQALKILNVPCSVIIYTDCIFIKNTVERGNPEAWKRAEWKKPSGEEVKNKELWQQFADLKEIHEIELRFSKHSIYRDKLHEILKRESEER